MQRVVVYTDTLEIEKIATALADYEIHRAASSAEVARAIVEHNGVSALIIEKTRLDDPFRRLLSSISKSFPILQICLIADPATVAGPANQASSGYRIVSAGEQLVEKLKAFVAEIKMTERRDHPRFDWPLRGSLSLDNKSWETYNLWSLSAEGAFLESPALAPPQGSRGTLRISFQNSRMVTECTVLDRRPPSSRLPAGFAVRFTRMEEDSMRLITRIVQDALIQTLLEPETEPEVPTLDDEDLSIPGFESF